MRGHLPEFRFRELEPNYPSSEQRELRIGGVESGSQLPLRVPCADGG